VAGAVIVPAAGAATLLAFADVDGTPGGWRLLSGGAVIGRGDELAELPEQRPWVRTVLAVPGTDVTMHWLELREGLTDAQAAAAARLQLADETLGPITDMHVAAGRREGGLTAVATVPNARMAEWIAAAKAAGMEPDVIIPAPMLLMPPGEGLVRYAPAEGAPDYRGTARGFSLEDDLAGIVLGEIAVRDIDEGTREAGLAPMLADPPINLRQGPFARRREVVLDRRRINWLLALGIFLLTVSLLVQINSIVRTTFAADRVLEEAAEVRAALPKDGVRRSAGTGFAAVASVLLESVRDTPNAVVTQMTYQADGSLRASILADNQATIDGIRARAEARGVSASAGPTTNLGGRAGADLTLRPR
jgi:general secretion pathway protein L